MLRHGIEVSGVSFGYMPGAPVLRDVSLEFAAGRSYAVVGASGSGKSTLLNLLMDGYDGYEGSIAIDGHELRDVEEIPEFNLDVGDFLTFADYFFDGFLADVMVQSRIRDAQAQVADAIRQVERIRDQLMRLR